MRVAIQYFDGCPSWRVAEERLRDVLGELGMPDLIIERERVETLERAQELRFRGSPTVLIEEVSLRVMRSIRPATGPQIAARPEPPVSQGGAQVADGPGT